MVALILVGCQEQAAPTPAPTPAPSPAPAPAPTPAPSPAPAPTPASTPAPPPPAPKPDEPSLSADEVCSLAWSEMPIELPDGYEKSQFNANTGKATYEGNGEWTFSISGSGKLDWPQSGGAEAIEKTPGNWVEQRSTKVTTYELSLTAIFNEETENLEIIEIEKSNEKMDTEITETPIQQVILLNWVKVEYAGIAYYFEGSIENVGKVPLKDIQVEFSLFDEDEMFAASERISIEPEIIAVGERAHFRAKVDYREKIRSYYCDFIAASGRQFVRISEDIFVLPP